VTPPQARTPDAESQESTGKPRPGWPEPTSPLGTVLYAVIAGMIIWLLITVLSHVRIYWH
jgi:hypothetical protein